MPTHPAIRILGEEPCRERRTSATRSLTPHNLQYAMQDAHDEVLLRVVANSGLHRSRERSGRRSRAPGVGTWRPLRQLAVRNVCKRTQRVGHVLHRIHAVYSATHRQAPQHAADLCALKRAAKHPARSSDHNVPQQPLALVVGPRNASVL